MNQSELDALKASCEKATKGKRRWFGNTRTHSIYLATERFGRRFIMEFTRWGMMDAQPMFQVYDQSGNGTMKKVSELAQPDHNGNFTLDHPDAAQIAATDPDTILDLIADLEGARKVMKPFAEVDCDGLVDNLPPGSVWLYKANRTSQETKGISYADVLRARRFLDGKEGK